MAQIINGKEVSGKVREDIRLAAAALEQETGVKPGLAVILVGEDPASQIYVRNKKKACEALGIISEEYALPENTTQEELLALIDELNNKKSINGILCQLPSRRNESGGAFGFDRQAECRFRDPRNSGSASRAQAH